MPDDAPWPEFRLPVFEPTEPVSTDNSVEAGWVEVAGQGDAALLIGGVDDPVKGLGRRSSTSPMTMPCGRLLLTVASYS